MKTLSVDQNFLGLPDELSAFEAAKSVVLPIPYEATTSYIQGTASGPNAILAASQQVEFYDDELKCEPCRTGISTANFLRPNEANHAENLVQIQEEAEAHYSSGKFVLSLGGEHSITIPLVRAANKVFGDFSVLQLDAHSDLRDSYEGSQLNHACVMARVNEICDFVGVGLRSGVQGEEKGIRSGSRLFYASEMQKGGDWRQSAVDALGENVYLTFDLDFFDPSIMPSVGTPEPGGFFWYNTLEFLKEVFRTKNVFAADIVELSPLFGLIHPDFLAAKLAYKFIGYKHCLDSSQI